MLGQRIFAMSIETRMSAYYWLFFMSMGSTAPFAALWFNSLGIPSSISGLIFAAPSIATVLFTVFIGGWADRLSDWRSAIIACNWIALIAFCWFLFRQGPWDVLVIWIIAGLVTSASTPIMDAAALNSTQKTGKDYARIRSFGSMGFIVGVMLAGWLFDQFGSRWFVVVLLIGVMGRLLSAYALPRFKSEKQTTDSAMPASGLAVLKHPGIVCVLAGAAFISASHGFYHMFSVLHWTNVGISTKMASILWSVSVVAEVALMWSFRRIARTVSARKCLIVAGAVSAVRWLLAGTDPGLAQLFLLQALHSITFGVAFLATVNFIAKRVHENNAAQAQSLYTTLMTLLMALSFWLSGWLYGQMAGQTYWIMSVLAFIGTVSVAWSFRSDLDDPVTLP